MALERGEGEGGGKKLGCKMRRLPPSTYSTIGRRRVGGGRGKPVVVGGTDAGLVGYYVVKGGGAGKKGWRIRRSSPLGGWGVSAQFAPRMFISADGMDMREPVSKNDR